MHDTCFQIPIFVGHSLNKTARQITSKAMVSSKAYIDERCTVKGREGGPLQGLTFAVKDMYDVRFFRPQTMITSSAILDI